MRWNVADTMTGRDTPPGFVVDFGETRVTVYMGFVSFMILIWEHIITFGDEVDCIWRGTKGPIVWLFFLNRYLTPLGFIINLFAYLSPSWTIERCAHFVRYEGSMTVIGLNTTALMMFLRVYAMYPRRWPIISFVAVMFLIELGVNAWLLTRGQPVIHDGRIHACTMIFDPAVGPIASASAWLPLLYDTIVLILTVNRTIRPVRHRTAGKIVRVLLRDGVLYYSVIFAVNLVLILMIIFAPPGLQNITAQLEYLLTVAMMSRITLHLKKQGLLNDMFDMDTNPSGGPRVSRLVPPTSRLCFARSAARSTVQPEINIAVEQSVCRETDGSDDTYDLSKSRVHTRYGQNIDHSNGRDAGKVEWYEMQTRA